MVFRDVLLVGTGVMLVGLTACYRPSDEYLKSKGKMPAPALPAGEAEEVIVQKAEEAANVEPRPAATMGQGGGAARGVGRDRAMGEPEMIDLFARHGSDALPELDKAISRTPENLEPLLRGAFAGVGNDTETCQDIMLYLVVHYPDMATQVAAVAGKLNPEIQSWRQ